ncbi:hypothetical protein ASPCAL02494 [Aspergillus calidoustus]|uniref:Zinc metallopeptidase n=1 Tax=Aspergillus calidoustus TaxID=454130 RepID=A0A0U5GP31_ASPCI|nr:hypothetical protein ASPCAL02494 [Aspergillus calidoustus]
MPPKLTPPVQTIRGVRLGGKTDPKSTWDITLEYPSNSPKGVISSIKPNNNTNITAPSPPFALPSLVHPHIHLDKPYIHNTPAYSSLLPKTGSFQEALSSTTQAKAQFTRPDLLRRGEWLLAESVAAGVTAMRAFVEVDHTVQHTCLEAGLSLKEKWKDSCEIQLVCFAQDPVFSTEFGEQNRSLVEEAIRQYSPGQVGVLGTTPYVETSIGAAKRNIGWAVELAMETRRHLDFHLDYNLSPPEEQPEPLVWYVLDTLREKGWTSRSTSRRVMLGHCTRLSLFKEEDWTRLAREIHDDDLPVSFVGLPTSDLYMAAAPLPSGGGTKINPRGTLPIPDLIKKYALDAVLGVNNVGNAFTPWGSADPLSLACLGVGIYQAGTVADAELLYECVSTRARAAIGLSESPSPSSASDSDMSRSDSGVRLRCGDCADILLVYDVDETGCFGQCNSESKSEGQSEGQSQARSRRTVAEVVWDPPSKATRTVVSRGRVKTGALLRGSDWGFPSVE